MGNFHHPVISYTSTIWMQFPICRGVETTSHQIEIRRDFFVGTSIWGINPGHFEEAGTHTKKYSIPIFIDLYLNVISAYFVTANNAGFLSAEKKNFAWNPGSWTAKAPEIPDMTMAGRFFPTFNIGRIHTSTHVMVEKIQPSSVMSVLRFSGYTRPSKGESSTFLKIKIF